MLKTSFTLALALFAIAAHAQTAFYQLEGASGYELIEYQVEDRDGTPYRIAAHHYLGGAEPARQLIVHIHGYIDNCGYQKPLQRHWLAQGLDVLCIELPGHGESSGARADVPYIDFYAEVNRAVFSRLPAGYHQYNFYGHSTGATGVLINLLNGHPLPFEHITLGAPLVKSYHYGLSAFAMRLFGWAMQQLPTRKLSASHPQYSALMQADPQLIETVPTHWFRQLMAWNKQIEADGRHSQRPITLIFAEKDTVISNSFNSAFIEERFPEAKLEWIEGSDHPFVWQDDQIQQRFLQVLDKSFARP